MKRKDFIKQTMLGGTAALILPPFLTGCSKDDPTNSITTDKKIIVIGGGIAGLSAAKKFKDRGIQITLLESQSKIGGRLRTNNSLGFAFDEGASWIHGPNGNPITSLASSAGANTFLTDDNSLNVFDSNGAPYANTILDSNYNAYKSSLNTVRTNGNINQSFQTVFNNQFPNKINDRLWKYMLSAYLEFDTGADISDLSSNQFDDDDNFSGADVIITNGYDKVAQYLAQGINILLNEKVSAIDYSGAKVTVTTSTTTYQADYVLVTVPLGVLKNNIINFTPALPNDKLQAISKLKMSSVNKFLLTFPSIFWDNTLQYIGYTPETKGKFNYFMNMNKFVQQNALMTFAFGNYSALTETLSDAQVTTEIMSHLKSIYGNSIPNPTSFLRTKWGVNPHTFGSYSFATTGTTTTDFDTLSNSVNSKLFFGGEHTNRQYRGTVHGAYLSGQREADKIISLL
ncbi:MAG: FAD-dependent oxidoreductase [Sediminibacterium sp.]|nr:FAD-dependent oxidoreductase [Sediminibacterium sp.]MBX9779794.1 FAD-dependent oxidoreductase [Chitinophagaceae bacterium]